MVNATLKLTDIDANALLEEVLQYKQEGWSLLSIDKDEQRLWVISMVRMRKG